jgi:hypothetical protein
MAFLSSSTLPVEHAALHLPSLEDVAEVLQAGLMDNFSTVSVEVRNNFASYKRITKGK